MLVKYYSDYVLVASSDESFSDLREGSKIIFNDKKYQVNNINRVMETIIDKVYVYSCLEVHIMPV